MKGVDMKLLNMRQLSELLNVKPKTIYDWVHRNCIPYHKLQGLLRFKEKEILRWLESKKHTPHKRLDT
jgi:excisionase family DNA binding protein